MCGNQCVWPPRYFILLPVLALVFTTGYLLDRILLPNPLCKLSLSQVQKPIVETATANTIPQIHERMALFADNLQHATIGSNHTTVRNQVKHDTAYNRYPNVYRAASRLSKSDVKILNFGSSVGLEIKTLAEIYFPKATLVGVDVNDKILNEARNNNVNHSNRTFFFNSRVFPLDLLGTYDMVVANSVLCLHPHFDLDAYPFSIFESSLVEINRVLQVGGLLSMVNPSYRLEDTSIGSHYKPVDIDCGNAPTCCNQFVPVHDTKGRGVPLRDICLFKKMH
eukprot:s645_g9.t1